MHHETKKLLLKNAIASAIIASVISFVSITFSTVQAQRYIGSDVTDEQISVLLSEELSEYFRQARGYKSLFGEIVHSFSYPGFWRYWAYAFGYLFVAAFLGGLAVLYWRRKITVRRSDRKND